MRHLLALCALFLALPALAAAERFSVISGGRTLGTLVAEVAGADVAIDFDFKDNGRGPTITEAIRLDGAGLPVRWTIGGSTTFGSAIAERFALDGDRATWQDATGPGAATVTAPALYIGQNASPWAYGLYARAVAAGGRDRMPTLPGGSIRVTPGERLSVQGPDGALSVRAHAISGIDLSTTTIFLDGDGALFAYATPGFLIVREGFEGEDERLRGLVQRWDTARLAELAKMVMQRPPGALRVANVRIFDPAAGALTAPRSVRVEGNRIVAVDAADTRVAGETVVDGAGGTLLPGMFEMHAHLGQQAALLGVAAGITTVRDMGNNDDVLDRLVAAIESGDLVGPRVVRSGFVEGRSATNANNGTVVESQEEAIAAIRAYARRGVFQIKVYNSINPAWVPAMIAEARRLGLRVAGHVPAFTTADAVMEAGYDELTHSNQLMLNWVLGPEDDTRTLLRLTALKRLAGYDLDSEKPQRTFRIMTERKVAHDPTLVILEALMLNRTGEVPPGAADWFDHMPIGAQRNLKQAFSAIESPQDDAAYRGAFRTTMDMIGRLDRMGVLIVPGTDLGGSFNYHRELELYTMAGMTAPRVLARATQEMADYVGMGDRLGSIAPGKLADFFLVPGDPTADIKAIKTIAMVVKDGAILFPTDVYAELGIRPFVGRPAVTGVALAR